MELTTIHHMQIAVAPLQVQQHLSIALSVLAFLKHKNHAHQIRTSQTLTHTTRTQIQTHQTQTHLSQAQTHHTLTRQTQTQTHRIQTHQTALQMKILI